MTAATPRPGCFWLFDETPAADVFTPEKLSDEHRMMAATAARFVTEEVLPALDDLERKDWALARRLLARAGELGLLGIDVPEADGGLGLDKVASVLVTEQVARCPSFSATVGGQTNLAMLPLVMFGTEAQRRRYLPRLLTGELVGAYALSEAGAGSDALGGKARAARRADGSFALSGEKMWITNGGFADLFIVFAKVDGERFTAFLVERTAGGVTVGREEHKMGLHGSSTTPLMLEEARVPAEGLLGEIGRGHKVAFNVLNFGRFKLGAACGGTAKAAIGEAARYAAERRQFGRPIASFGAIKHKLGDMVARTYALESLVFRTAGAIDARIEAAHQAYGAAVMGALEELAVEASIAKVAGSEILDFVLDENIQIHGGNGFVRDYPAERHYRDSRVNRIFEGTNEINRLLIPTLFLRRARARGVALSPAEGTEGAVAGPIGAAKQAACLVLDAAARRFGDALEDEQEILTFVANMLIEIYAAESAALRAREAARLNVRSAALQQDAADLAVHDGLVRIGCSARQAIGALTPPPPDVFDRLVIPTVNTVALRRRLAEAAVEKGGYPFAP